jgi:hypothetical protein
MPKKTKKQKIIADYHRKMHALSGTSNPYSAVVLEESKKTTEKKNVQSNQKQKIKKESQKHSASYEFSVEKKYIKYDLTKTLLLSVLAIVCLVVIYLGSTT